MAEKTNILKIAAFASQMRMEMLPPELKWQADPAVKHWNRVAEASDKGEPVNWSSFANMPEIFYAMGIPTIVQEEIGVLATVIPNLKLNEKYIDIAHEHGVSEHVCSTQKVMIGAALCDEIPLPTTIVHSCSPCDSTIVTYSMISEYFNVPHFVLDIPSRKDERAVQYVADELEMMIDFLEEHTGKKLEDDKLREVMGSANIAREYNLKINELTKLMPSPLSRILSSQLMDSAGTPEAAEYFQKLYESGKKVVETGEGYPPNQKIRAGLFSTWVGADNLLFQWLQDEFGVVLVNTMLGTETGQPAPDTSSRRKIMVALARNLINAPMVRECWSTLEDWFHYAIPTCRDWKLDVVILTTNIGCKNMWAAQKLFKDRMVDELGIPVLFVAADFCDGRTFSNDSIRAQFSDFFKTMIK